MVHVPEVYAVDIVQVTVEHMVEVVTFRVLDIAEVHMKDVMECMGKESMVRKYMIKKHMDNEYMRDLVIEKQRKKRLLSYTLVAERKW